MDDEQVSSIQTGSEVSHETQSSGSEATANTSNTETRTEETKDQGQASEKRPNGYERVEFSPEQQARFDRLYGQVKAQDRKYQDALNVLKDQSQVIEQLQRGVGQVVDHINNQDFVTAEQAVRDEADRAFQKGDSRAYLAAMEKVSEIKARKIVAEAQRQQPRQDARQPAKQQVNSAVDVGNRALQQGALNESDMPVMEAWQNERDERGNLIRPWAHRDASDPGTFDSNLLISAAVFNHQNSRYANFSIGQKLAEVDRLMGLQRNTSQQNVMGSNLTTNRKTNTVRVSADMEKVLLRTAPRGPRAKDAPDPVEWYRKQVNKAKQQGGRR